MHHVTPLQPGSGSAVPSCPSTPRPRLSSYQLIWPRGELALDFQKIMRPSPLRVCRREGAVPLSSWGASVLGIWLLYCVLSVQGQGQFAARRQEAPWTYFVSELPTAGNWPPGKCDDVILLRVTAYRRGSTVGICLANAPFSCERQAGPDWDWGTICSGAHCAASHLSSTPRPREGQLPS